jgi:hypothetical protein
MIGALKNKFSSITSMIPDWKGPMTVDLRLLKPAGEGVMEGFMDGVDLGEGQLRKQLGSITSNIPGMMMSHDMAISTGRVRNAEQRLVFDVTGTNSEWKRLVRKTVRVDGGGSTDRTFGRV